MDRRLTDIASIDQGRNRNVDLPHRDRGKSRSGCPRSGIILIRETTRTWPCGNRLLSRSLSHVCSAWSAAVVAIGRLEAAVSRHKHGRHLRTAPTIALRFVIAVLLATILPGLAAAPAVGSHDNHDPVCPGVADRREHRGGVHRHITPFAKGRTVSWYVGGHLEGQSSTNPNGIATIGLTFGAGGYGINAVLEPVDGADRAESDEFLLLVTQDPQRLPDKFIVERLQHRPSRARATRRRSPNSARGRRRRRCGSWPRDGRGRDLNLVLQAPRARHSSPAPTPAMPPTNGCEPAGLRKWRRHEVRHPVDGPRSGGCPVSYALMFSFQCDADQPWPIVGAIRYNSNDGLPFLSLPTTTPAFDSVIEGHAGSPPNVHLHERRRDDDRGRPAGSCRGRRVGVRPRGRRVLRHGRSRRATRVT